MLDLQVKDLKTLYTEEELQKRIKEIADYVTDDNNNEGVKNALERFCL